MARQAVDRRVVLLVAADAETHRMIDFSLGYGLCMHVAVAGGAIDAGPDMRGVIELHMSRRFKSVHSLPWNVFAACFVRSQLLDFGLVRGDDLMAGHAEIDAGDSRVRPSIDAYVAIGTLHAVGEMNLVGVSDRLNRLRAGSEEFADGVRHGTVPEGENRRRRGGRLRRRSRILSGHRTDHKGPPQYDHAQNSDNTYATTYAGSRQRPRTLV